MRLLLSGLMDVAGGVESMIKNIVSNFSEPCEIDILMSTHTVAHADFYKQRGSIFYKVTRRRKNPLRHYIEVKNFFKYHKYDFVWHNTSSPSLISIPKHAKISGAKLITHSHSINAEAKGIVHFINKILGMLNRKKLAGYTDYKFACTQQAGEYLFGKEYADEIIVVRNGIDVEKFQFNIVFRNKIREEFKFLSDEKVIGMVGRFVDVKNHSKAINIMNELVKRDKRYKLLLVGDGKLKNNLVKQVNQLNLTDNIIFAGTRQDVNEILSGIDIYIMTSYFEGLPVSGVEAQCSGACCVFSQNISAEILLTKQASNLDINLSDSIWADKIENLTLNYSRAQCKQEIIKKGYSIKSTAKQVEEILLYKK